MVMRFAVLCALIHVLYPVQRGHNIFPLLFAGSKEKTYNGLKGQAQAGLAQGQENCRAVQVEPQHRQPDSPNEGRMLQGYRVRS